MGAQIKADVDEGKDADAAAVARWSELSSGYQTVKAVMEEHGDVDRAQLYHRYEVESRLQKPTARRSEKVAAWLYKAASDYGASIARPPLALFALWVIFAGAYILLAYFAGTLDLGSFRVGAPLAPDVKDALSLSFKNALLNLDSFGGTGLTLADTSQRMFGTGWISGLARFFGAMQTFLSLILAFLFGLAVRRKFQIR